MCLNLSCVFQLVATWSFDQVIISYFLLDSRLCYLPPTHKLWKPLKLVPPKEKYSDDGIW